MNNRIKKISKKLLLRVKISKSERIIYLVVLLWIIYGILTIWQDKSITQMSGYYTSLTLFISTYLWGEHTRTSKSTTLFKPGENSSREVLIYLTLILWCILGSFGVFYLDDINALTVYFSSLSPFVISYIIYKTTKKFDNLPIFDGTAQKIIDKAISDADSGNSSKNKIDLKEPKDDEKEVKKHIDTEEDFKDVDV